MKPDYIIAGRLTREYLLPPEGQALLDRPGGNLLYASGGLAAWTKEIGLLGRVDEDYPQEWLIEMEERGFDIGGINRLPQKVDMRSFIAYTDSQERSQSNPVAHFARRQLTFPKSLLGYTPREDQSKDDRKPDPMAPSPLDIPKDFRDVPCVHLCPMPFANHNQLVRVFRGDAARTLSLDPSPGYMAPEFWRDLRQMLKEVTIFMPSENEMRSLFWEETHDVWQMAGMICENGPRLVVIKRGTHGQYLYDSASKQRWELPAYPASRPADPTGAGDAFCGGFLAGFHITNDPVQAALYGNISASLKIEGSGPFYPLEVMPGLAQARLQSLKELVRAA